MSPAELDAELTRAAVSALRAPWLTPLLVLLSAWPVKGPLLAALAVAQPGAPTRRLASAAAVGVAAVLGSLAATLAKALFDRARPPDTLGIEALVALPGTAAFPSGHATTAAAAATALALLVPRWRAIAVTIALLVAASRVLLGLHHVGDVLAGLALGALVGAVIGLVVREMWARAGARPDAGGDVAVSAGGSGAARTAPSPARRDGATRTVPARRPPRR